MLSFHAEIDADRAIATLGELVRAIRDLRPLYEEALEPDFYRLQTERFDTEGGARKWEPLSPVYAAKKAEHFPGRRILELTGTLRESLTKRGAAEQVRRISATTMELGTAVPYAGTHHLGSSKRMWIPAPFYMWINGVPRREVIDFTPDDERRWQALAEDYYRGVVGRPV